MTPTQIKKIKKQIEDGTIYYELRYRKWRARVYKRDGYRCQMPECKYPMGNLNAHHIYMKWYNPTWIYDIKNGITLCTFHHKECHKIHSDNYIELFEEIALKNCKKPIISKKIFGKKKRKTKKKTKKKTRRGKSKVLKFKKIKTY